MNMNKQMGREKREKEDIWEITNITRQIAEVAFLRERERMNER